MPLVAPLDCCSEFVSRIDEDVVAPAMGVALEWGTGELQQPVEWRQLLHRLGWEQVNLMALPFIVAATLLVIWYAFIRRAGEQAISTG